MKYAVFIYYILFCQYRSLIYRINKLFDFLLHHRGNIMTFLQQR